MIQNKNIMKMDIEIQVAVQFIVSYLEEKFGNVEIVKFSVELGKLLAEKFEGHWYPDKPSKGSAYRCLSVDNVLDAVLVKAANLSSMSSVLLSSFLPKKLNLWVDPTEVSYRIGEHGTVVMIYKEGDDCVNSTSKYLAKVLETLPTVTPKESPRMSPLNSKSSQRSSTLSNPLIHAAETSNTTTGRRIDNHLSASAKSFVSRNGALNLPFLNNRVLPQTLNPLLNLEYLQKLQQWPLLATGRYDPLAAQLLQNFLIMQELQRFESRRLALQSHYLKIQSMRWPKKFNYHSNLHSNRQHHPSVPTNNGSKGLKMSA